MITVPIVHVDDLVGKFPAQEVDLVKMDIEGAEQGLISDSDLTWLEHCKAIIAEFHPDLVDYRRLTKAIESKGMEYLPAGSQWQGSMDMFFRRPVRLG